MKTYLNTSVFRSIALWAAIVLTVAACGGGGGGIGGTTIAGGGTGGTGVSFGVMTKGSVIVNGVRFDDTAANIVIKIDDSPKGKDDLRNGMVVKVLGTVSFNGIDGTAQRIRALVEVRGTPTSLSPLTVLGQVIIVDDQTVFSNLIGVGAINSSTLIEVHGFRDVNNQIRATRIEATAAQMGNANEDEIRGVVTGGANGNNPPTFTLGTQAVNAAGATITPAGATYANNSVVEVHCTAPCIVNGVFQASRIVVEDFEDAAFKPNAGQRLEAEGIVSGLSVPIPTRALPSNPPPALSFSVAGVPVTTSGSTQYVGGIYEDMNNNIKVEAEGTWNGTVLVANKIEFKRSVVRLQGVVLASPAPTTNTFTLQIGAPGAARNVAIETDGFTEGDGIPSTSTACVQVRGQRKAGGGIVVTAGEIKHDCSQGGDHVLQAPVEAKASPNLTLLGFTVDVTGAQFEKLDDTSTDMATFFGLVTAANPGPPPVAGTLVRVRFDRDNLSVVKEVELED